jgi:hypothetical protein
MLDVLFRAVYQRLPQSHRPLTDRFAQAVVDTVVAVVRSGHTVTNGNAQSV